MDYYNKYLKYKTKYLNLKYYNNQYGGKNKFICEPDPKGKYPTYDTCIKAGNRLFKYDEGAPRECESFNTLNKVTAIRSYMSQHRLPLSETNMQGLLKATWDIFNKYSREYLAMSSNTPIVTLKGICGLCGNQVGDTHGRIKVNELYFHAVCPGAPDECNLSNTFIDTTPFVPILEAKTSMSQVWKAWGEYFVRLGDCFHCKEPVFKVGKNMKNKPYYAAAKSFQGIIYQSKRYHNRTVVTHIKDKCFNSLLDNIRMNVF
jgi:hypothetical protein